MSTELTTALGNGITSISSGLTSLITDNVTALMGLFLVIIALPFVLKMVKRITGR